MSGEALRVTNPRERRAKRTFLFKVSDDLTVRIKKTDPVELIFSGALTMPMLEAAMNFEDIREKIGTGNREAQMEAVGNFLKGEDKAALVKFAREYAMKVVMEPVLTEHNTGDLDKLWIEELDTLELLAILNAEDPNERSSAPTREEAFEFRRTEQAAPGDVSQSGEDVRSETKLMDTNPIRDTISA
jgi:hypothetical protein